MKLTFLGAGSAFTVGTNNYQSNMLLENDQGQYLLIDCGTDIRFSLNDLCLSSYDIHDVYISHLHADHVGGLEWLAFTTKFDSSCKKPNLYLSKDLVDDLWNNVLKGGLTSLKDETAELGSYFNVHAVNKENFFTWQHLKIHLVKTLHIIAGTKVLPSYGLFFTANKFKILLTSDTQMNPDLNEFYENADIIFHDCETAARKSGVHSHYDELKKLPEHIKRKMWLYHYNPCALPDAITDGFRGFVKKGQCFDFANIDTLF